MKITSEQIEALKNNEKPFGRMSMELQNAARSIGVDHFLMYCADCVWRPPSQPFANDHTYCLFKSYQPESEVVECEIYKDDLCLVFDSPCGKPAMNLAFAASSPDFIGFKFEGDHVSNSPIMYLKDEIWSEITHLGRINKGECKVLHATAVLLRKA